MRTFPILAATLAAPAVAMPRDSTCHMDDDAMVLAGYDPSLGYDDELGAVRRVRRVAPPRQVNNQQRMQQLSVSGGNTVYDQFLPFDTKSFTAAISAVTLTGLPQRAFRLKRLTIDFGRVGASATGLILVSSIMIGADPQFVGTTGSIPASMFASNAVGITLKGGVANTGNTVTVGLSISPAPTAADTVLVSAGGSGPALNQGSGG